MVGVSMLLIFTSYSVSRTVSLQLSAIPPNTHTSQSPQKFKLFLIPRHSVCKLNQADGVLLEVPHFVLSVYKYRSISASALKRFRMICQKLYFQLLLSSYLCKCILTVVSGLVLFFFLYGDDYYISTYKVDNFCFFSYYVHKICL